MIKQTSILTLLLCLVFTFQCKKTNKNLKTTQQTLGLVDLKQHDFQKQPVVTLNSPWLFLWQQFCASISPDAKRCIDKYDKSLQKVTADKAYVKIPHRWNKYEKQGKAVGGKGYASYHLRIALENPPENLSLHVKSLGTAYELWVNQHKIGVAGKISQQEKLGKMGLRPNLYLIPKKVWQEQSSATKYLNISLNISNYHHRIGGLWNALELGKYDTLSLQLVQTSISDFLLFGAILIMGIYHIGLYSLRKKDSSPLWFGILCLLVSLRILLVGERYLEYLVLQESLFFLFLEYIDLILLVPAFGYFLISMYPRLFFRKTKQLLALISIILVTLVIALPSFYYTQVLLYIQLYIVVAGVYASYILLQAVRFQQKGARLFLGGWFFYFFVVIHDLLYYQLLFQTTTLLPLGLFVFIISQAIVLSMRFSQAFRQVEEFTENLEQKVKERTKEIETLNDISKAVHNSLNFDNIMQVIEQQIQANYDIDIFLVSLINHQNSQIETIHSIIPPTANGQLKTEDLQNIALGHIKYKALESKKRVYAQDLVSYLENSFLQATDPLPIKSLLCVPLILQGEVIGFLELSNYNRLMPLNSNEIESLEKISAQLTSAIYNSNLLKETQRQKQETEALNRLIKSLNEELDLKVIMQKVQRYVKENFSIEHYGLLHPNSDKTSVSILDMSLVEAISKEDAKLILNLEFPINKARGAHSFTFRSKRLFFVPNVNMKRILKATSEEELIIVDKCQLQSFLIIPLILQNEPIGTLDLFNTGKMNLSKDDMARLSILGEQLAGIIYSSNLFQQVQKEKEKAIQAQKEAEQERQKSDSLLLNILPKDIAKSLKETGYSEPVQFDSVSVLFTDFKGFTEIAERLTPAELVKELDGCFVQFDKITERYNLEKLKTIGDSYMCAGGIPQKNTTHAVDSILAALEIQNFMNKLKELKELQNLHYWEIRLGIHSGPLVAGVIGEKKFAYDVWGDTVNIASRMESSGTPGRINISGQTYEMVQKFFNCEYRGKIDAKSKGQVDMYYVLNLQQEYSKNGDGITPNAKFWLDYTML
ncbi:MAG: adenylate/guanylate cyclase domain-containing protein [Spirochaetota bacterium]